MGQANAATKKVGIDRRFLPLLLFVEMWERFSYYGMRAILVLFLVRSLGFSDAKAMAIYSLFAALGYAGPVLGGYLADRLMGFRKLVVLGGVIMTLGHALLALVELHQDMIYFGLGFVAVGTGLFKGNVTNLLGACYEKGDPERDRGFTLFYVAVNVGSVAAALVCGGVGEVYGWHYGFALAGVGMLAGLLVFLRYQSILGDRGLAPEPKKLERRLAPGVSVQTGLTLLCLALALASALMLQASDLFKQALSLFGILVLAIYAKLLYQTPSEERKGLIVVTILMIFNTCFFALEMQLGSLINLFAARNVDNTIFGLAVPGSYSQAINPLSIIVLGPFCSTLFMRLGSRFAMARFSVGLLTMALCFLLLYLSGFAANASGQVPYVYLFVAISLMGLSELCIAPLLQGFITLLAPERVRGFMMGVYMLSLSFANLAGFLIAHFMSVPQSDTSSGVDPQVSLAIYQTGFYEIMLFNVGLLVVFGLLYPYLQRTLAGRLGFASRLAAPRKRVSQLGSQA